MFDPCGSLVGLLLFVVPPATICWTAAIAARRYLRDRPVGVRHILDAAATGCWLQFVWLFLVFSLAIVAGGAMAIPFLALADTFDAGLLALFAIAIAVVATIGVVTWKVFWPILKEEWRRLTTAGVPYSASKLPEPTFFDDGSREERR